MPHIFDYTDYRLYLEDFQKEEHEKNPHFSHRYFAQRAGFSSSGLLSNIMKGRRNLTDALLVKFLRVLKLTKKEELYFEALVRFNQAASQEEKNRYYLQMLQLSPLKAKQINKDRHEFYSRWWYSAVRELLYYFRFKDDYQTLARQLDPPISIDQAKEAIGMLDKLGMIKKDANGYYSQTDTIITTGERREHSLNVKNFQIATIDLAKDSLQRHSKDIRNISTLTLTLSPESVQKAFSEIETVQNKILALAEKDRNVNSVYQINFQMFPLTRPARKR